jgi:hypothetical protein
MNRFSRDPIQSATMVGYGSEREPDGGMTGFHAPLEHPGQIVKDVCAELRREARRYSLIEHRWLAVAATGAILMLAGIFLR